ncbi:MAG: glycosyltransferase family 39 protein [Chlorobiaceae bacterium]|nr:glycosyltransferase family 39 protein [Chlorobiaceae bacterium]NTV60769.1 glycosyltransferase family 39 protein [Chlorobiaceae bacterium]
MEKQSKLSPLFWVMLLLTIFLYMVNFSVNDIWTENESFYAEAVREMMESGNYLDINFNYEPRFNKPPLTYWLIIVSSKLFGLNEFGIRLPFAILSFGTILLVWGMARMLYGEKTALLAFAMQAISIQYISLKAYASPETPLAFFFTLTLYLFLKGHLSGKAVYYSLSAVALGLTVLTKGYPYMIIIGGIILFFLMMESGFKPKVFLGELKKIRPVSFVVIAACIGLSWVLFMTLRYGSAYLEVLDRETFNRAMTSDKPFGLEDLVFYPYVILWGFYPYSLIFIYAFFNSLFVHRNFKENAFAFSWFAVMFVVFTVAKGKIPTYFIQANPALVLITATFLVTYKPVTKFASALWNLAVIIPVVVGIVIGVMITWLFNLPAYYYLFTVVAVLLTGLPFIVRKIISPDSDMPLLARQLSPFVFTLNVLLVFSIGILPLLEKRRPIDEVGRIINEEYRIPSNVPLYLDSFMIHNLPFYAERKVIFDAVPEDVFTMSEPYLALLHSEKVPDSLKSSVIWKGDIYRKISSESRFMILLGSYLEAEKGDMSGFEKFSLVYKRLGMK